MTLPVATVGDVFLDTDVIASGSPNVFINNKPVARLGDMTTGHTLPGHGFYPPVPITSGSGLFFANNLPAARLTDTHGIHCDPHPDCHDSIISTGSGDVFAG